MEVVAMSRVFTRLWAVSPVTCFCSWGRLACSVGCRKGMEVVGMSEEEEEEEEEEGVVCGQGVGSRHSSLCALLSLPL